MVRLEKMIHHLSQFSIDDRLYWQLTSDSLGPVEIAWARNLGKKAWQIRQVSKPNWHYFSDQDFVRYLASEKDIHDQLTKELRDTVLNQAAFAQLMLDQSSRLFGKEQVAEAVEKSKGFINDLQNMVNATTSRSINLEGKKATEKAHQSKRDLRVIDNFPSTTKH